MNVALRRNLNYGFVFFCLYKLAILGWLSICRLNAISSRDSRQNLVE
jgi:hypothetical protein